MEEDYLQKIKETISSAVESQKQLKKEGWSPMDWFFHVMGQHETGIQMDPKQFLEAMILFFLNKSDRLLSLEIPTVTRRMKTIEFVKESGNIYLMYYKGVPTPSILVGLTKMIELDSVIPFFLVFDTIGISYWDNIRLQDVTKKPFLHKIVNTKFNFEHVKVRFENVGSNEIFENMEKLSDCTFECSNGKIKTSKFLLSQNSRYMYTYFTRYSNRLNVFPLKQYPVEVFREYLRFLITKEIQLKNISELITESLDMANYFQDLEYMEYVYDLVYPDLELDAKKEITQVVKQLLYPNK